MAGAYLCLTFSRARQSGIIQARQFGFVPTLARVYLGAPIWRARALSRSNFDTAGVTRGVETHRFHLQVLFLPQAMRAHHSHETRLFPTSELTDLWG